MRIAIDARFINPENRGLSCYTKNLIESLAKIDQKNEYYILLLEKDFKKTIFKNKNFHKIKAEIPWYSLKEQWAIPRILKKIKPDLTHFPHFNVPIFWKEPFVTTIHDLILFAFPTKKATTRSRIGYFIKEKGYFFVINHAIFGSKKIISVSKNTAKDIRHYFPKISSKKIEVVYEGLGETDTSTIKKFSAFPKKERGEWLQKKLGIPQNTPFILYLGGAYPHKNLERLSLAFKKISPALKEKVLLVIAGGEDFFFEKLKKFIRKNKIKNILLPGFIGEKKTLEFLYLESLFCIFPSLYEGFGLPPLEALKRKKLVLCSRSTSFPEILQDKAVYFNGNSLEDIGEKVKTTIEKKMELEKKMENNLEQFLCLYDWEKMARETLEVYKKSV